MSEEEGDEEETECFRTQAEAIEASIQDLRRTGGGTMTIHHGDCALSDRDATEDDCDCDPVQVEVEGAN